MVDLESMRARVKLHGAPFGAHADRGISFQHDLAVYSRDHGIVGARVEVNPFRAGGEPHTVPANSVESVRSALLIDEREIDGRRPLFNECVGRACSWILAFQRIVETAGEPGGWRNTTYQEPESRQDDREKQVP